MSCNNKNIPKEISIPYPLYQSKQGNYFIGETPILIGRNGHALAALVNPIDSNVTIYVNAMTITNISALNISAEFYVKTNLKRSMISDSVSAANLDYSTTNPEGEIRYLGLCVSRPILGVSIFSRIVPPYSTLVVDGSQIILPPGQSILIYLGGLLPIQLDITIVAFGWWEEMLCTPSPYCY